MTSGLPDRRNPLPVGPVEPPEDLEAFRATIYAEAKSNLAMYRWIRQRYLEAEEGPERKRIAREEGFTNLTHLNQLSGACRREVEDYERRMKNKAMVAAFEAAEKAKAEAAKEAEVAPVDEDDELALMLAEWLDEVA